MTRVKCDMSVEEITDNMVDYAGLERRNNL